MRRRQLLLVWHSRTGLARAMADALERGAHAAASEMECGPDQFTVCRRRAADVSIDEVLGSDGYLFCAPENLASTSGEMLEFFHRSYYLAFTTAVDGNGEHSEVSQLAARPVGIAVAAGSDGSSAARQMERICLGWRLRPVAETLVWRNGEPQTAERILQPKLCPPEARERCKELGGLVAATLLL
jgi:multimeric flavodoxin WrbA